MQGNYGASPAKEMRRPGTPWRGQPFAVPHPIFMAFSGKRYESWAERSELRSSPRSPGWNIHYSVLRNYFLHRIERKVTPMDSLCFSDENHTKYHANRTIINEISLRLWK